METITAAPRSEGTRSDRDKKLRVLFVVRNIPHVPSTGGLTRMFHLVRAVAQIADVTLVSAADDPAHVDLTMMQPICQHIRVVPCPVAQAQPTVGPKILRPVTRAMGIVHALTRSDPFPVGQVDRLALRHEIRTLLQSNHYDVVVVDHTQLAGMLRDIVRAWSGPSIATLHDALSVLEYRKQETQRRAMRRRRPSISGLQVLRQMRSIERGILRSYSRVAAVSELDARNLRRLASEKAVDVIPNGVDIDYFAPADSNPRSLPATNIIIFTGFLAYYTNSDSLRFFVDDIWPLIRGRRPDAQFWIVGANPTPEVEAMARHAGIEVFASVPDVRPYLEQSTVAIVPLRLGSGTRLKILEALAANRPVVSTTLGAEGLHLESGHDLLRADTPAEFADAVVTLLECPDDARALAAHGQETVRRLYSWDTIGTTLQQILRQIVANSRDNTG